MIDNRKKTFDYNSVPYLPNELVYIIVDFLDYEKYYKPQHYELLKGVINNIGDMASTFSIMQPSLSALLYGNYRVPRSISKSRSITNRIYGVVPWNEEDDEQPHTASSEEGYFGGFWYNGWDSD
tara:strand:+ start:98 stop:469 length:372 start_codon:yes stop_codon:yes gene_type:complete